MNSIIIGAGPSIFENNHLEILANSNFKGNICITDKMLKPCLEAGIIPDKFSEFFVFTVEDMFKLKDFLYDVPYCNKINLIHSTRTKKSILKALQDQGYNISCWHWPYLSITDNVGLMAFHYAVNVFKNKKIIMIGMDHGDRNIPIFPENTEIYKHFYRKVLDNYQNPLQQLWYDGFMDLLELVPKDVQIINATEGGTLYNFRIQKMTLKEALS